MTNPNNAVGTNAAYGTRTSVNAFNDFCQLVSGRGIVRGWSVRPKAGMVVSVGGIAGTRDVAVAEDNLGNRTTINNISGLAIDIEIEAASVSSNRYDAIVAYVNNPAQASDESPDAPSVCGIIDVQGGTTGVSEQQIRSAISADGGTGSTAYYVVLATILVSAGMTTITSTSISQQFVMLESTAAPDGGLVPLYEYVQSSSSSSNVVVSAPIDLKKYAKVIIYSSFEAAGTAGNDGVFAVNIKNASSTLASTVQVGWQSWDGNQEIIKRTNTGEIIACGGSGWNSTFCNVELTRPSAGNWAVYTAKAFGGDYATAIRCQDFMGRINEVAENIRTAELTLIQPSAGSWVKVYGMKVI